MIIPYTKMFDKTKAKYWLRDTWILSKTWKHRTSLYMIVALTFALITCSYVNAWIRYRHFVFRANSHLPHVNYVPGEKMVFSGS